MPTVQLFVTCLVDSFFPQTGEAVVDILHRLGIGVDFAPDQTCCGQPQFNAGLRKDARAIAEHTIRVFENTTGDIVTPSGSCAHMFRHNYPELFEGDSLWLPRAKALAERTYEFTEYLVDKLNVTDLGARWDGALTYHPSCHTLRGINVDRQPRALLAKVKGATLIDLPHAEECCGFGGIMSVEHPELSAEWLKRKISNLEASQAPVLVVTDAGCRMHIAGGLNRQKKSQRVMHIAEVLNGK
ncbi:MAG TPA: (Fe-S)-binding protein [Anaerolineales bacterium]|nr:(Fe-S)-binding protein [Anaerolineales bacterium]HMX20570.1 (Fe-S)-binding protein [Anaerolineales bacterium]HNC90562.1 (Fe-S)-binding protein [Anaerolineales bacterium]